MVGQVAEGGYGAHADEERGFEAEGGLLLA